MTYDDYKRKKEAIEDQLAKEHLAGAGDQGVFFFWFSVSFECMNVSIHTCMHV